MLARSLILAASMLCLTARAAAQTAAAAALAPEPAPSTGPAAPLVEQPASAGADCVPACRGGFFCHAGACVSLCNPACAAGQRCTAQAQCIAEAAPAPVRIQQAHDWEQPARPSAEQLRLAEQAASDAATADRVRHMVELSIGVGLLRITKLWVQTERSSDGVGVATTRFGTLQSGRFGVGYGLSGAVILAADLGFGYAQRSQEAGATTNLAEVQLMPTLRYLLPGTDVFLGTKLMIDLITLEDDFSKESDTVLGLYALLGAHVFVAQSVSVDPQVAFGYLTGSGTLRFADDALPPGSLTTLERDMEGFDVAIDLGLSVWL